MKKHYLLSLQVATALALTTPALAQHTGNSQATVDVQRHIAVQPMGMQVQAPGLFRPTFFNAPRRATEQVFTPDWHSQFDTQEEFDLFTVIDGNEDQMEGYGGGIQNAWSWRSDSKCAWYNCWAMTTDDWLVTPGLQLRAGKTYTLRFKTTTMSTNFPTSMDVMLGTAATAESLATPILTEVETNSMGYVETTATFTVADDNVYYIGFHLTKVNYMLSFYLDDVYVEGEPFAQSPAEVTNLTVTPDATGAVRATVSFTLPTTTADGSALEGLVGVRIRNNGSLVADLRGVEPGHTLSYTVEPEGEAGYQTYTVVAYNDVDEGVGASATAYVGLDTPTTPQNLTLTDGLDHITVNWDASTGAHEGVFFPELVTYRLYNIARNEYNQEVVGDVVDSIVGQTTLTLPVSTVEGEQTLKDYLVNAENAAGPSSNYYRCYPILLGKPYDAPFLETFDGGNSAHFWMQGVKRSGFGSTGIASRSTGGFDTTPGCVNITVQNAGDSIYFYSGKIALEGSTAPRLAFKLQDNAAAGTFRTYVKTASGQETMLEAIDLQSDEHQGEWQTLMYDLSAYAQERFVQVGFTFATDVRQYGNSILLDHVFVGDMPDTDLWVELEAPKSIVRGEDAELSIRVNNLGAETATAYTVRLLADGEVVSEETANPAIGALDCVVISSTYHSSLLNEAATALLKVEVTAEGAAATTAQATIALELPETAPTTGLAAEETADGAVLLTWDEAPAERPQTDKFESYSAWSTYSEWNPGTVGQWTMIDGDKGYCWGFSDYTWYGSERNQFAYTVFNPYNYDGYGTSLFTLINEEAAAPFIPHSGNQYMAAIYSGEIVYDEETGQYVGTIIDADNWLISPEQDGREQEISFWVNNYCGLSGLGTIIDHVETYEVLASSTDNERESFTVVGGDRQAAGGQWQQVKVLLPAGTKFFAIRHKSQYNAENGTPFIFMVDDVSTMVDNEAADHYNIYRDGQLLAQATATTFTDVDGNDGKAHLYQVTVVYADGQESVPVTVSFNATATAIDTAGNAAAAGLRYDLQGRRAATLRGVVIENGKKLLTR